MTRRFYAFPNFVAFFSLVFAYHAFMKKSAAMPAAPIPTLLELVGVPDDLDAQSIAEDFLGLSRESAQRMVEEWDSDFMLRYGEELMIMAEKGFTYYLPAYIDALKNFLRCGDEEERASLLADDFRNLLDTIGFHAEWHPDTERKNQVVVEDFLRFYESEAPERHSASVTMAKIRAAWEEA